MLMRMVCDHAIPGSATTGALGFDDLKWLKPVRPGDILSVETVVREKTESRSRPDIGVVKIESRVLDQRGESKMTLVSLVLYRRRAARPPA
jgi:acyl dehydratase